MKKLIGLICVVGLAGPVLAHWSPEDGHKMHFPQLPDPAGWDVDATFPLVLADDWQCAATGYVDDIHFWGQWRNGNLGEIVSFTLRIYADIPADPPAHSRPGALLWEWETSDFIGLCLPPGPDEGWYAPSVPEVITGHDNEYCIYNITDIPNPFRQEAGTIYWLSISATVADPVTTRWGWKSTQDHWNDDAVWAEDPTFDWAELYTPPDLIESLDLAFVINGRPAIPAVTGWGLAVLTLLVLVAGGIVIARRRATARVV